MKQLKNLPIVYYILLGKDSCNGDSGGPLMSYNGDFKGTKYLRGIVSFGTTTCGNVSKQNIIIFINQFYKKIYVFFREILVFTQMYNITSHGYYHI